MNRINALIALCVAAIFSCNDVEGQGPDLYTDIEGEPDSRTWVVYETKPEPAGASTLFTVDDVFYLQKETPNRVIFKSIKVNNSDIRGTINFTRYKKDKINYLCTMKTIYGDHKRFVISPKIRDTRSQITIEYEHMADNSSQNCNPNNVVLSIHGGLAHAHAVR